MKPESNLPELMSVQDMAKYLGMGQNKAYEMVNKGELPAIKIRGRWKVPKSMLENWVLETAKSNLIASCVLKDCKIG